MRPNETGVRPRSQLAVRSDAVSYHDDLGTDHNLGPTRDVCGLVWWQLQTIDEDACMFPQNMRTGAYAWYSLHPTLLCTPIHIYTNIPTLLSNRARAVISHESYSAEPTCKHVFRIVFKKDCAADGPFVEPRSVTANVSDATPKPCQRTRHCVVRSAPV